MNNEMNQWTNQLTNQRIDEWIRMQITNPDAGPFGSKLVIARSMRSHEDARSIHVEACGSWRTPANVLGCTWVRKALARRPQANSWRMRERRSICVAHTAKQWRSTEAHRSWHVKWKIIIETITIIFLRPDLSSLGVSETYRIKI
jgi:hypothetical protein